MANLIIGNGEDLRALVDSLFTLRDPEKEAALSEEEREALRRKREEEIPASLKLPSVWAAALDRHTRYGVK